METLAQDVRLALRGFRRTPAMAAVAIACMALGIGASTAMFSVVEAVLLRPLPFADPDRIVVLHRSRAARPAYEDFAWPDFYDLAHQGLSNASVAAATGQSLVLNGVDQPQRLDAQAVSAGLFSLLGVPPALGRDFSPEDDRPGAAPTILLSDGVWHRAFRGDRGIVGHSILVDGTPHTVVGVMPPEFAFPARSMAWVPLAPRYHASLRTDRRLMVLARLRPGTSAAALNAELAAFARRQAAAHPAAHAGWKVRQRPLRDDLLFEGTQLFLNSLLGAVLFVLLIACANVANLQLSRATSRQREMAVRFAFGAGSGRILRQLLTESLLLALAGGVLGVAVAEAGMRLIVAAIPRQHLAYWLHFTLDGPVLLFTLSAAVATGVLFGLAPAAGALRRDVNALLKDGSRNASAGRESHRLRSVLVVVEIALALVLLVGTSLAARNFLQLRQADIGFDPARILTARVFLAGPAYDSDTAKARRIDDVLRRIAALPGVERAAAANLVPLGDGGHDVDVAIDGQPAPPGPAPTAYYTGITAQYFAALGAPMVAGRALSEGEVAAGLPVAVVNDTFARSFWPNGAALGHRFKLAQTGHGEWITVVGVVGDFRGDEQLVAPMRPSAYLPYPYQAERSNGLIVRSRVAPATLTALIRRQVHAADPGLALYRPVTMENLRLDGAWTQRLFSGVFAGAGALALLLAAIGIYGVLSYAVSQRQREIGVRIALGAQDRDVMRLVLGQALRLTAIGLACGIVVARALAPILGELLYQVSPTDPANFGLISLFLGSVALLASLLPARRALRADPLDTLRQE